MKKKMVMAAAGALSMGLAQPATAQIEAYDWKSLGSSGGESAAYNALSVTRNGGTVTVTLKLTFTPPQTANGVTIAGGTERVAINCAARTYVDMGGTKVDPSGKVVTSWDTPGAVESYTAGSPVGAVAAALCP